MALSAPARPRRAPAPESVRPELPWLPSLAVALAVLLASSPIAAVVQGVGWIGYAAAAVLLVAAIGTVVAGLGAPVVVIGQVAGLLLLVTGLFCDEAVLGVLPGPEAFGEMAALAGGAVAQIQTAPSPVPLTPEIAFLVTLAVGLIAVAAHLAAVVAGAPATAGVALLVAFAVPTALADDLLPWWTFAAGAAAFGLLLVVGANSRRLPGAVAVTAAGVGIALLAGVVASPVGTDGRFAEGPRAGADIGLDPFTALRGQLTRAQPEDLLSVSGLPRPTYLRALTLRDYVPDTGWQAGRPDRGVNLTGPLPVPAGPGEKAVVEVENIAYRDYWLPLYGDPLLVTGVDDEAWAYDPESGIAYTSLPREEGGWEQEASLPSPTAAELRAAGRGGVDGDNLVTSGVDPRVRDLAEQVAAGATTDFDRAMAVLDWFTAPGSPFRYSLQTAPGNGDDALVEFLTVGRIGYCEQYASAMAIMLRTLGVPARVAIGFTGGSPGADDPDARTIRTSDAHAWVEVWFEGQGWQMFDPTPLSDGRTIEPPYVQEARAESGSGDAGEQQEPEQPQPDGAASPPQQPEPPEPAPGEASAPEETGLDIPVWPFVLVAVLGVLVAAPAGWRALQRRRRLSTVATGGAAAATAAWEELLAESADRGVQGHRSDTVRSAARRIVREHRLDDAAQASIRQLVGAVEASWYGLAHPAPHQLDAAMQGLRTGIEARDPLGWKRMLLPRSVFNGMRAARGASRRTPSMIAKSGT
ncbi:transglutaminase TgpA family protein [Pseudonocardia sp.]|uniref:transglutaminase TgpA family protein n=1 Tax=Pseudonocardia sp. TaxID=60912 RepID=UPI003D0E05B2